MNLFSCLSSGPERFRRLKLVLVGSENVGKSSLFSCYTRNIFPAENQFTVYDYNDRTIIKKSGKSYVLRIFDAPSQQENDQLRVIGYVDTHAFVVCFSVMSAESFQSLRQWIPELRQYSPSTPILIVGLQTDRRSDVEAVAELAKTNQKPISTEEGKALAKELNAEKYLECSAMTRHGVVKVFKEASSLGVVYLQQLGK